MTGLPKFFKMSAGGGAELAAPEAALGLALSRGCENSEFQFLDHAPLTVRVREDSGDEFPDFLFDDGANVPLVSDRFYRRLVNEGVDNLFYKPIDLTNEFDERHRYWLALPPRIRALSKKSKVKEDEDYHYREATRIIIDPAGVGNYQIFELADVVNNDIIVTERLKTSIERAGFTNVFFDEVDGVFF